VFILAGKSAGKIQYRPTFYVSVASSIINQQFFTPVNYRPIYRLVGPVLWMGAVIVEGKGGVVGMNLGCPIVTNGNFIA